VLVVLVWSRMVTISWAGAIWVRRPVVVRRCIWWVFLLSWRVHGRVIGRACRFVTGPCPVSRIWGTPVLLWALFHLPRVLVRMASLGSRRLYSSHGHVPTLPLT
jgi:hypothetical protein